MRRRGICTALLVGTVLNGCATVRQLGSAEIGNTGNWMTAVQIKTKGIKGPDVTTVYAYECNGPDLELCQSIGRNSGVNSGVLNAVIGQAGSVAIGAGVVGAAILHKRSKLSVSGADGGSGGDGGDGGAGAKGGK